MAARSTQPTGKASALRVALAEVDANVPLYDVQTMDGRIECSLGPRRLAMLGRTGFGALAVALAALGIYGVIRYTIRARTPEIGVRLAIVAKGADVVWLVLRQGILIAATALAVGLAAAFALARLMRGVLFGVVPHEPATFVAATALLAAVAFVAIWVPARNAARLDPIKSEHRKRNDTQCRAFLA